MKAACSLVSLLVLLALLALLAPTGCTSDDCLDFAFRRCDCCGADQIDTCKAALEQEAERNPPTDLELQRCKDDLAMFEGCQKIPQSELDQLCALKPEP